MKYVYYQVDTEYCGTAEDGVLEFDDGVANEEIDDTVYDISIGNAESYEYLATGWENDFETEEDREDYYNSCTYMWGYITKEDYDAYNEAGKEPQVLPI